jgi:homeobox-leucine zipper protein
VLKRYYENLTEDNRRLKKELQEMRALKQLTPAAAAAVSSPVQQLRNNLYRPLQLPAATLTMCPSCENAQSSLIRASFRFWSTQENSKTQNPVFA